MTAPAALSRVAWALVTLVAGVLLLAFYAQPIGPTAAASLATLTLLAVISPFPAILILIAITSLPTVTAAVVRLGATDSQRLVEAFALAFVTGWAARRVANPQLAVNGALKWSAAALALGAIASGLVGELTILAEQGHSTLPQLLSAGWRPYAAESVALAAGVQFALGLVVFLAVLDFAAAPERRLSLLRTLVVGAAAAALMNVLRLAESALRTEHPWSAFADLVRLLRFNVHHGDLNAAGSYFALALFATVGLGLGSRPRWLWLSVTPLLAGALWMSGSRTALLATLIASIVAAVPYLPRPRKRPLLAVAALVLAIAGAVLVFIKVFPMERHVSTPALAASVRAKLARTAAAMALAHPVFGVGAGRFHSLSADYAGEPFYSGARGHITHENAHNNVLQIVAELGVPALGLFACIVALPLAAAYRHRDLLTRFVAAAIVAFVITWIGGHPLLVLSVAIPFWIALGALVPAVSFTRDTWRPIRQLGLMLIVFYAVALPFRAYTAAKNAYLEHTSVGFSLWQDDGEYRYRWAGGRATFYVSREAYSIRLPMRGPLDRGEPVDVRVFLDGREATRITLYAGEGWKSVRLPLPPRERSFYRIDLEATEVGNPSRGAVLVSENEGLFRVGRPIISRSPR